MIAQNSFRRKLAGLGTLLAISLTQAAIAQTDLTGVWSRPSRSAGAEDPRLAVPPIPPPPIAPAVAESYASERRAYKAAEEEGRPFMTEKAQCLPDGMPVLMETALPIEILQTPGKVTLIAEFNTQVRHIYLGGKHPPADELAYGFFGSSIGQWEGDTLIVETIGIRQETRLFQRAPHSDKLKIIERFRLLDSDLLEVLMTIEDPDTLAGPWEIRRLFQRQHGGQLQEYVCENNRHTGDSEGRVEMIAPPED